MQVVASLNLNRNPRVWNPESPYYLSNLKAVMISYADFDKAPVLRERVMEQGVRAYLSASSTTQIYLDNGAFAFLRREREVPRDKYREFVERAKPDWYAIPQDYIPAPHMSDEEQLVCLQKTMQANRDFNYDGYVPVIHISRHMDEYLRQLQADTTLLQNKEDIALGGIVPNLLKMSKAMKPENVLDKVRQVRTELKDKTLHVFGVGGIATLHLAALLGVDSVDSAGWRSRAARGIIQLPGRGERIVANLGSWRGREPDETEWKMLVNCPCPACQKFGAETLQVSGMQGFCCRATHNLWILLDEARQIDEHLADGTYEDWYSQHVESSTYKPLIDYVLTQR